MRFPTDAATRSLAVLILFTAFSGDFWANLLGPGGQFGVLAALAIATAGLMTVRRLWSKLVIWRLPRTLLLFGVVGLLAIAWSGQAAAAAVVGLGLAAASLGALFLTTALGWPQLLAALSTALCWVLGLSVVFEFVAAVFVRQPVHPFWGQAGVWSNADLFRGGPALGITGDPAVLAFAAVLAAASVALQLAQGLRRRNPAVAWLVIAALVLGLTRSVTAIAALVVMAALLGLLLLARRLGPGRRVALLVAIAAAAVAGGVLLATFRNDVLAFVASVGAGTASPAPFDLWAAVGEHLGIVGVVLLIAVVVSTWHRSWWFAVDQPLDTLGLPIASPPLTLAPALLVAAVFVQSFAQSPALVGASWLLLVLVSISTKLQQNEVSLDLGNGDAPANALPSRSARAIRVGASVS